MNANFFIITLSLLVPMFSHAIDIREPFSSQVDRKCNTSHKTDTSCCSQLQQVASKTAEGTVLGCCVIAPVAAIIATGCGAVAGEKGIYAGAIVGTTLACCCIIDKIFESKEKKN